MTAQEITALISLVGLLSVAINVYVGLRLAAVQAKLEAESATLKAALLAQFVTWKDDLLSAINGKYVSAQLIAEIRSSIGRELAQLELRLDHVEERCQDRARCCSSIPSSSS